MMKNILIVTLILLSQQLLATGYNVGETLYVAALNGINVRKSPSLKGKKLCKLNNGDKVIVLKKEIAKDYFFDFEGKWISVKILKDNSTGFLFDTFISKFPTSFKTKRLEHYISGVRDWPKFIDFMPNILEEYAENSFKKVGTEMNKINSSTGDSAHKMNILEMENGIKLIKHQYHEGSTTELELKGARDSEIYYLVMNLVKMIPDHIIDIDERVLKNIIINKKQCVIKNKDFECLVMIQKKEKAVSIKFNFPCC